MRICWLTPQGKKENCITIPGGPPPYPNETRIAVREEGEQASGVYSNLFADAWAVNAIHHIAKSVSDESTRKALHSGVESAVHALQQRIGDDATISLGD